MARQKTKVTDVSPEIAQEAEQLTIKYKVANQTKEQTKLIEQGIRKGLLEYKKQHKSNLRDQDKVKKKIAREKQQSSENQDPEIKSVNQPSAWLIALPWILLAASWAYFTYYG